MASFKEKIAYRKLKNFKQFKKAASFSSMHNAKTVGLIYNVNELSWKEVTMIIKFFEEYGKSVTTLGFLDEKELSHAYTPNFKHMFFCKEQMTFWKLPMVNSLNSFVSTPFDYLINLDVKGEMAIQAVSAYSHASTRIGMYMKPFEFCQDLMVHSEAKGGIELFEHIKQYIK